MTTTTKAQIQSQLEEARATIDRQRNEIANLKALCERKEEAIDNLRLQLAERESKPTSQPSSSAWETIKKSWRRRDTPDYYRLCSGAPGAMALALQAQEEMTRLNKRMYVSTSNGEVYVAVRK